MLIGFCTTPPDFIVGVDLKIIKFIAMMRSGIVLVITILIHFNASLVNTSEEECLDNSVDFMGRLGNLMFEYASLVGICKKFIDSNANCASKNVLSCARIKNPKFYEIQTPISELVEMFNLSTSASQSKPFNSVGDIPSILKTLPWFASTIKYSSSL